jgi:hypothetical protein
MKVYGSDISKGDVIRIPSLPGRTRVITVGLVEHFSLVDVPGRHDISVTTPELNHYLLDSIELYEQV